MVSFFFLSSVFSFFPSFVSRHIVRSEFQLESSNYGHFQIITPPYLLSYGFNRTITVLLQESLWH